MFGRLFQGSRWLHLKKVGALCARARLTWKSRARKIWLGLACNCCCCCCCKLSVLTWKAKLLNQKSCYFLFMSKTENWNKIDKYCLKFVAHNLMKCFRYYLYCAKSYQTQLKKLSLCLESVFESSSECTLSWKDIISTTSWK